MRPSVLEHWASICGPGRSSGLSMLLSRQRIDAVAQMALYRPEFFGKPMFTLGPEVLRGPSYWTPAEREYFAVFTSRLNECPFCVRIHTETTRVESAGAIDVNDSGFRCARRLQRRCSCWKKSRVRRTKPGGSDVDAVRAVGGAG